MRQKFVYTICILSLVFNAAVLVGHFVRPERPARTADRREKEGDSFKRHMKREERRAERFAGIVQMTDEQKAQYKAIRAKYQRQKSEIFVQTKEMRTRLNELMCADTPDREAIRALVEKSPANEFFRLMVEEQLEVNAMLTPEQRKRLAAHNRERDAKMEKFIRENPDASAPEPGGPPDGPPPNDDEREAPGPDAPPSGE